jgi:3-dehydroquinate dehydratase/shikimate dehydrogenase
MAIVVSHLASTFDRLARQALRQVPLSDLIELRLDDVGDPGEERLRALVKSLGRPVIVTLKRPEEGGSFRGDVDEQLDVLRCAARAGAAFVDVDWSASLELGELGIAKCHRIVSRHDREGSPEDLREFEEEVRNVMYEGDLIKLVTQAHCAEDALALLNHLRQARGGLIAFSSGEAGAFSRVLCRIFGSPFTYAAPAIVPGEPVAPLTAPGQMRVNDLRAVLPPGGGGDSTAVFGVVGDPVEHSLSPRVHDMALKGARLDAVYVALRVRDFERFLRLADDPHFRGFSVTAPHKLAAFRAAKARDEASHATSAANTLVRDVQGWRAANTDVAGVGETLERAWRFHLEKQGKPVLAMGGALAAVHALVLGAGGAARAAAHAVLARGGRVTVCARRDAEAQKLARELRCAADSWAARNTLTYDVLIHATPAGSLAQPDATPIEEAQLRPSTVVLDAVYRPLKTPLLAAALRRGCTAVPGAEWFVRQAHAQFRLFTQHDADEDLMRKAFEHALH